MHEDTLTALGSRINEVKDLVRHLVLHIKQDLILLIHPVVRQVGNADALPHVSHRVPRTIHNMSHLIRRYKFQIL